MPGGDGSPAQMASSGGSMLVSGNASPTYSRKNSFAAAAHIDKHGAPQIDNRTAWMFRNRGADSYVHLLRQYFAKNAPGAGSAGSDGDSSCLSRRSSIVYEPAGSGPARSSPTRHQAPHHKPSGRTPRAAIAGDKLLETWQDLTMAPLLHDTLNNMIPQFSQALMLLLESLACSLPSTPTHVFRLSYLTRQICTRADDAACPLKIRLRCQAIRDLALQLEWTGDDFVPPLTVTTAEKLQGKVNEVLRIRASLAVNMREGRRKNGRPASIRPGFGDEGDRRASGDTSVSSLYIRDPRTQYTGNGRMTFLQELLADTWSLLNPDFSRARPLSFVFSSLRLLLLVSWAVSFTAHTMPEFYCDATADAAWLVIDTIHFLLFAIGFGVRLVAAPSAKSELFKSRSVLNAAALIPYCVRRLSSWLGEDTCSVSNLAAYCYVLESLRVYNVTFFLGASLAKLSSVLRESLYMFVLTALILLLCIVVMSNLAFYIEMNSSGAGYDCLELPRLTSTNNGTALQPDLELWWVRYESSVSVVVQADGSRAVKHVLELSPFQSQLDFYWWCVATLTTVGYGDAVPTSDVGRLTAGICMVVGVLVFAIPASVVCGHFTLSETDKRLRVERTERVEVREYVRTICGKSSEPFAQ
eukprot:gene11651-17972_t